jgi:hypothetical protein
MRWVQKTSRSQGKYQGDMNATDLADELEIVTYVT